MKLFNRSEKNYLVSPCDGGMIALENVNDEAFSSKSMGDGFAIKFNGNKIVSPVDGNIVVTFPTGHAIGIQSGEREVLVHIGIDTVEMNGEGFVRKVNIGDSVKKGDVLVEIPSSLILEKGYDPTTIVVITSGEKLDCLKLNQKVSCNEKIASFI